jgi:hypothetical protein
MEFERPTDRDVQNDGILKRMPAARVNLARVNLTTNAPGHVCCSITSCYENIAIEPWRNFVRSCQSL